MEAAWTFMHIEQDLYLILNAADGNGFRCMGFQTPDAPYPTLLTWAPEVVQSSTGICKTADGNLPVLGVAQVTIKCKSDEACTTNTKFGTQLDFCEFEYTETGEWRTDGQGPPTAAGLTKCDGDKENENSEFDEKCPLEYWCGFLTNEAGQARSKMVSNGGTVWNVKPLACQGKYCEKRWTQEMYLIRTLATGDADNNDSVDEDDYRCLYFPSGVGSIPRMVPEAPSTDGIWLGIGGAADEDGNGDKECGIALIGEGGAAQNKRLGLTGKMDTSQTAELGNKAMTHDDETQEKELLLNHQATFRLIKLPNF